MSESKCHAEYVLLFLGLQEIKDIQVPEHYKLSVSFARQHNLSILFLVEGTQSSCPTNVIQFTFIPCSFAVVIIF